MHLFKNIQCEFYIIQYNLRACEFFLLGNYDKFLLLCMHKPVFNLNVFIESKDLKIHGILLEINLVDLSLTEYFWKLSSDFFMEC